VCSSGELPRTDGDHVGGARKDARGYVVLDRAETTFSVRRDNPKKRGKRGGKEGAKVGFYLWGVGGKPRHGDKKHTSQTKKKNMTGRSEIQEDQRRAKRYITVWA